MLLTKKFLKIIYTMIVVIAILLVFIIFWVNVLKSSYYIPVSANYYQCSKPYISAYTGIDETVMTTVEKKDYCVDLSIDFRNYKGKRKTKIDYTFLLLDFDKLKAIESGSSYTFFTDPIPNRNYVVKQKNIGYFYLDFLHDYDLKTKQSKKVLPKLRLDDPNLKKVLFK